VRAAAGGCISTRRQLGRPNSPDPNMERPFGATPDRSAGQAVASRDEGSGARTLLACVARTADQIGVDGLQKRSPPGGSRRAQRARLDAKHKSAARALSAGDAQIILPPLLNPSSPSVSLQRPMPSHSFTRQSSTSSSGRSVRSIESPSNPSTPGGSALARARQRATERRCGTRCAWSERRPAVSALG
jgi:hypothetical protein